MMDKLSIEFLEELVTNKKLTNQQIQSLIKQEIKQTVDELLRSKTK
jgi:hypothetical protein